MSSENRGSEPYNFYTSLPQASGEHSPLESDSKEPQDERGLSLNELQASNRHFGEEQAISSELETDGQKAPADLFLKVLDKLGSDALDTMREQIKTLQYNNDRLTYITERLREEIQRLRDAISPSTNIEGEKDIKEEIAHLMLLRREHTKRYRTLEIEHARKGLNTSAEVEMELDDIRGRLTEVDARIKILIFELQRIRPTQAGS